MRTLSWPALLALLVFAPLASAQTESLPFTVEIVEREHPALPALHSFAAGHHDGEWLLVTGRTDGLHGFGENPFPEEFATTKIWVIDPASGDAWSASIDEFGGSLRESLRVTNAQHVQLGEMLYVIGGYGHSADAGTMITFPTLTAINLPGMIAAVKAGAPLAPHLRQIEDDRFRVTGGELEHLGEYVYLVGGNRFDGEYSGPGSEFFQEYTYAIARFRIDDDGQALGISDYEIAATDDYQMRRRDLTVAPVVWPGEREGFALYAGVFRPEADFPWVNPIYFFDDDEGRYFAIDTAFEQKLGHYTAPALPLYDDASGAMHTTIFGGMAMYFVNASGELQLDPLVPFVRDVITISRDADGATEELLQDFTMPGLLGTNMAYLPADGLPRFDNGVIRLASLGGRTFVGHLFGGLEATAPNPGRMPHTGTSFASRRVFEVFVTPLATSAEPTAPTAFEIEGPFPNPTGGDATVALVLDRDEHVRVEVFDMLGRRVALLHDAPLAANQRHAFTVAGSLLPAGAYVVRVAGETFGASRAAVRVR
jgi:hypothetical protein